MAKESNSFESSLEKLEEIVAKLHEGDRPLDESLMLFEEGIKLARAANVKQLILFHHDPIQSDAAVREKERRARAIYEHSKAAYEGLVLDV